MNLNRLKQLAGIISEDNVNFDYNQYLVNIANILRKKYTPNDRSNDYVSVSTESEIFSMFSGVEEYVPAAVMCCLGISVNYTVSVVLHKATWYEPEDVADYDEVEEIDCDIVLYFYNEGDSTICLDRYDEVGEGNHLEIKFTPDMSEEQAASELIKLIDKTTLGLSHEDEYYPSRSAAIRARSDHDGD